VKSPIPDFSEDGLLPIGNWECTSGEFVGRFCLGKAREPFRKPVLDICEFALSRGATQIVVGGSFITASARPGDLDCLLVFPQQRNIPERTERLSIGGVRLDVLFCSEEDPRLLGAYVHLFAHTRNNRQAGIVSIKIQSRAQSLWQIVQEPDDRTIEIVQRAYIDRQILDLNSQDKALVTIHGIRSQGEWNAEIVHIASSNGWIVAPFFYGYQSIRALSDTKLRDRIVDRLREHICDISSRYGAHVSVIAHSFGTYLITRYLLGFDVVPYSVDTLILTGSILNKDLDLERFRGKVASIVNEIAPNDPVVSWARAASLYKDDLIGDSGRVGFTGKSDLLVQGTCEIFTHENVIKRDVIVNRWMPRLEAFVARGQEEAFKSIVYEVKSINT